ncbi:hypothetical protein [Methylobacterium sp. A54F]
MLKGTGAAELEEGPSVASERDAKRWSWSAFTFADVCAFRLAKLLIDAGLEVSLAREIASADQIWHHQLWAQIHDEGRENLSGKKPEELYIIVGGPGTSSEVRYILTEEKYININVSGQRAIHAPVYLVVSLKEVRRELATRIKEIEAHK